MTTAIATKSGQFTIGDEFTVNRLGFGAMRITGDGIWGEPKDPDEAVRVLRRAVELGVNFIDTADAYGPFVSEELIATALHPYPDDLVIATKAGLTRSGPNDWRPVGRPEYLRQQCELSLRHLKLERIPLYQLHRIDPKVPAEESLGELKKLQDEGKIGHIGLSEVDVDELRHAQEVVTVATVQNQYNLSDRKAEALLDHSEQNGIGFIPWNPLAIGRLSGDDSPTSAIAARKGVTPSQLALAWLLHRSPVMLPIPGTSSVAHLEDNVSAADIGLSADEMDELTAATG